MSQMTYLDAAYRILKQAKQPLHYKEITHRALEQGLIEPRGLTPEAAIELSREEVVR